MSAVIITAGNFCYAKQMPHMFEYYKNKKDYPEYEAYMQEYYDTLNKAFQPEKYFTRLTDLQNVHTYQITKDGKITDFSVYEGACENPEYVSWILHPLYKYLMIKNCQRYDEYVKGIIYNNPPKPFPKEVEYEAFDIHIYFAACPHYKGNLEEEHYLQKSKFVLQGGNSWGYRHTHFTPPEWRVNILRLK